jgi:hypothetical protein
VPGRRGVGGDFLCVHFEAGQPGLDLMTEHLDAPTLTGRPRLSGRTKAGLGLAAVLGLLDISGIFGMSEPPPGEESPPPVVLIGGAILGLITIAAVIYRIMRRTAVSLPSSPPRRWRRGTSAWRTSWR